MSTAVGRAACLGLLLLCVARVEAQPVGPVRMEDRDYKELAEMKKKDIEEAVSSLVSASNKAESLGRDLSAMAADLVKVEAGGGEEIPANFFEIVDWSGADDIHRYFLDNLPVEEALEWLTWRTGLYGGRQRRDYFLGPAADIGALFPQAAYADVWRAAQVQVLNTLIEYVLGFTTLEVYKQGVGQGRYVYTLRNRALSGWGRVVSELLKEFRSSFDNQDALRKLLGD